MECTEYYLFFFLNEIHNANIQYFKFNDRKKKKKKNVWFKGFQCVKVVYPYLQMIWERFSLKINL